VCFFVNQSPYQNRYRYLIFRQYAVNTQQPIFQGYPQPSLPQDIPRIHTTEDPNSSPHGLWDARSPTSSDSGWSNASSPLQDHFGEEFHDDGSDFQSDNRSYVSDVQYQEEFDIESFLSLGTSEVVHSPDTTSPTDFLSGPDAYIGGPSHPNPFPSQSLQYNSPYNPSQGSPTFSHGFANSFPNMGNTGHDAPAMKPTHNRAYSDFLSPPPIPINRSGRSHSRGGPMGHRSTISEGSPHMFLSPEINPDSSIFISDDLRGRGLSRARSAPSAKAIPRGKSPYDRPASQSYDRSASQTEIMRLEIPSFIGSVSGQSSPELESPSPASAKDVVATDAMVQASAKRRKRAANYFCRLCSASFTTENSKRRHESSHSGEKPYVCTKEGCSQTFSNDDDRKRHENKSKKHALETR